MQQASSHAEGRDLRSIAFIVWRRKWIVLIPTLVGLLAGVVIGHPKVLRPVYRASATLLLDFPQPVSRDLQSILQSTGMVEQLGRLQSLMQSNEFLLKVADASGLRDDQTLNQWVAKGRKRYPDMTVQELQDLQLAQYLRGAIKALPSRSADNVVVINVLDYYPDRARLIVQNLTNGVIDANKSAEIERVRALHDFSLEQLAVYKERLSEAENRLEAFRRGVAVDKLRVSEIDEANVKDVRRMRSEAADDLTRYTQDGEEARATLRARSPNSVAALQSVADARWTTAVKEITDLEDRLAREVPSAAAAGGRVGATDETTALLIARRIQELEPLATELVGETQWGIPAEARSDAANLLVSSARVAGAKARLNAFDGMLAAYDAQVTGTPREETTVKRLMDDIETNQELYNAFVQQLASSQIGEAYAATKAAGRLTVLEPASRPLKPIKPNRVAYAAVSTLLGFLLGLGALALVERQDVTLRDSKDAERTLGLRVLATVPQIEIAARAKRDRGLWNQRNIEKYLGDSPAYQELRRVALELRNDEDSPVRSVLLTSACGGEGKTTASILLGAATANEDQRVPVLLVDLDFRRGALGRLLDIDDQPPGVLQALEHHRIDDGSFRETCIGNLHVLPLGAGVGPRNDLLTFENLSWLIPELTRRYGLIIIDSPPNVPVPDALIIGQLVDAVLIVIKAGSTSRHMVERGVELQKQFTGNVRGILMNNVDEIMPYYYDYRHYGYANKASRG